jgi:hypothetical protein
MWVAAGASSAGATASRSYDKPWMVGSAGKRDENKKKGYVTFADSAGKNASRAGVSHVASEGPGDVRWQAAQPQNLSVISQEHRQNTQIRQRLRQQPGSSSPASPEDMPISSSAHSSIKHSPLPPHHRCGGESSAAVQRSATLPPSLFDIANSSPSFDFQGDMRARGVMPVTSPASLRTSQPAQNAVRQLREQYDFNSADEPSFGGADSVNSRDARVQVVASLEWLTTTHMLQVCARDICSL